MMKKWLGFFLPVVLVLGLTACGSTSNEADSTAPGASQDTAKGDTKVLVAYFSATGTTKAAAETLAEATSADIFEIVPSQPYTDDDLNYNDTKSRSTVEQNDPNARPEISGTVENWNEYDVVFIGYPIWWYEEPRIVDTFVEKYDFSGKTVIPFCTSGGSGIGESGSNLEKLTSGAVWMEGQRLQGSVSQSDVESWVDSLGLDIGTK